MMEEFAAVADRGLQAARAGAKVLIIRNTVGFAVRTQQALEERAARGEQQLLIRGQWCIDATPRSLCCR